MYKLFSYYKILVALLRLSNIIYKGSVYDIGEYINEHPGGADILEAELGKNIDEPFEEAEHT